MILTLAPSRRTFIPTYSVPSLPRTGLTSLTSLYHNPDIPKITGVKYFQCSLSACILTYFSFLHSLMGHQLHSLISTFNSSVVYWMILRLDFFYWPSLTEGQQCVILNSIRKKYLFKKSACSGSKQSSKTTDLFIRIPGGWWRGKWNIACQLSQQRGTPPISRWAVTFMFMARLLVFNPETQKVGINCQLWPYPIRSSQLKREGKAVIIIEYLSLKWFLIF